MIKLKIKTKSGLVILLMLSVVFCTAIMPAQAATDLKTTSTNLYALRSEGTWKTYGSGELLISQSAKDLYIPYQKSIWVSSPVYAYGWQAADYQGYYYGQCVSLVKTLSKSTKVTGSWIKGRNVISSGNVLPGTVIATFSGSSYYGHAAIFRGYVLDSYGKKIGIKVWDQNWVKSGLIGRHSITTGTSSTSKATNYYVVQV